MKLRHNAAFLCWFSPLFFNVADPRYPNQITYPLAGLAFAGVMTFLCRLGARRQIGLFLRNGPSVEKFHVLFGVDIYYGRLDRRRKMLTRKIKSPYNYYKGYEMREPVLENEQTLNRAAKKALMSMKVVPSPDVLYCLQLAKWTSKHPTVEVKTPALLENLDTILYGVNPKNVMSFLLDEHDLISDLKGNREPLETGVAILNQLGRRLGEIQDLCEAHKRKCPAIPLGKPIYPLSRMLMW